MLGAFPASAPAQRSVAHASPERRLLRSKGMPTTGGPSACSAESPIHGRGRRSCCQFRREFERRSLSGELEVSQAAGRDADPPPAMNRGGRSLQKLGDRRRAAEPIDDLVSFRMHVPEHAIIGSKSQAKSCDIRHCDNRKLMPNGRVDDHASLRPEAASIFRRLEALGKSQRQLADALGIEENKVSKVKAGTRQFQGSEVLKAHAWLDERERERAHAGRLPDHALTRSADAGEAVEIIQLDLSLPMGPGATVDDYIEEEPRLFDLAYIRSFTRTPPSRLRLARGVGDSMFPTLLSNDLVWIDSTQTQLNQSDRIWAVSINGGAAIKRLRPLKGGGVMVMSDNPGPGHESYEVGRDEIMIGGRVIRFARDL